MKTRKNTTKTVSAKRRTIAGVLFVLNTVVFIVFFLTVSFLSSKRIYLENTITIDEESMKSIANVLMPDDEMLTAVLANKRLSGGEEADAVVAERLRSLENPDAERVPVYSVSGRDGSSRKTIELTDTNLKLVMKKIRYTHGKKTGERIIGNPGFTEGGGYVPVKKYTIGADADSENAVLKELIFYVPKPLLSAYTIDASGNAVPNDGTQIGKFDRNDIFRYAAEVFKWLNDRKDTALLLLAFSFVLEILLAVRVWMIAGYKREDGKPRRRAIDGVPLYIVGTFCAIFSMADHYWIAERSEKLRDLPAIMADMALRWKTGADSEVRLFGAEQWSVALTFLLALLAAAFVLYLLITTVSVRLKTPDWWKDTILYRLFVKGNMEQRARSLLWTFAISEFTLLGVLYFALRNLPASGSSASALPQYWVYLLVDLAFVLVEVLYIYIFARGMSYLTHRTHRIAREKKGSIDVELLQDPSRAHARNINSLSRSANVQMEQKYINEDFSIRLINSVSHGLRGPLRAVAENVRLLEAGGLSPRAEQQGIDRIADLSQEIKKTIEDLIRVSRASTGAIETDPMPTDAVEMLNQAVGEYYPRFAEKELQPKIETPPQPLMIRADSEFMWNIFDGILSAVVEDSVPGTHVYLSAMQAGDYVMVVFRGTVHPPQTQSDDLSADRGYGLPFAKVYAELQGGNVHYKYSGDMLTAVLRFPAILQVVQEE